MTSPSVAEDPPWRSDRARSLRSKPSAAIASATRSAVAGATAASPLITRETVLRLTPADRATSRIVGREVRNLAALHHQLHAREPATPAVRRERVADAHVDGVTAPADVVELQRLRPAVALVVLLRGLAQHLAPARAVRGDLDEVLVG